MGHTAVVLETVGSPPGAGNFSAPHHLVVSVYDWTAVGHPAAESVAPSAVCHLQTAKISGGISAAAILISANWFIYIWAVNHGHIVETSLGYYINPLVSVVLGMIVLKERLNVWQWISFALACLGVCIMTFQYGTFPWVALSLAFSFGFYGLVKKLASFDAAIGLTLETMAVTPISFVYLLLLYNDAPSLLSSVTIWQGYCCLGPVRQPRSRFYILQKEQDEFP